MRIWKRGSVYWYEFIYRGQRVQRSSRARDKETARNVASAHRIALINGDAGIFSPTALTLEQFGSRFLDHVRATASSDDTKSFYELRWASLVKFAPLAGAQIHRVDEAAVANFIAWRRKQSTRRKRPVSVATVNRDLATLRKALRLAHEWRLINRVPRIRLLKGEAEREYVLPRESQAIYLAACAAPLDAVAALILETGLRAREAASMRWSQVQLESADDRNCGFLRIVGKGRKKRVVPLTAAAARMLERMPKSGAHVFGAGVLVSSLDHQHARARRDAKFPPDFVIHSLRHTFLTRLGAAGVDAFTIMRIAGHSSITVSQRYVHPTAGALESAMRKLADAESPTVARSGNAKSSVTG